MDLDALFSDRFRRSGLIGGFESMSPELANEDAADLLPEAAAVTHAHALAIELEPMVVAIEYRDAEGNFSRRRITTKRLLAKGRAGVLQAWCHERNAPRTFALDAILAVIDGDGVVTDPKDFWREIGVDTLDLLPLPGSNDARRLRDALRPGISVLTAMAKVDGRLADRELLAILDWVEDEAHERGIDYDVAALAILEAQIRRLSPGRDAIRGYLKRVLECSTSQRFIRALRRVILADGEIAAEEARLMQVLNAWARNSS